MNRKDEESRREEEKRRQTKKRRREEEKRRSSVVSRGHLANYRYPQFESTSGRLGRKRRQDTGTAISLGINVGLLQEHPFLSLTLKRPWTLYQIL